MPPPSVSRNSQTLSAGYKFDGAYIILPDLDLIETERAIGCFCFYHDRLGLSFKGLRREIKIKVHDSEHTCYPGTFQPIATSAAVQDRLKHLLRLWHILDRLTRLQADPVADGEDLDEIRLRLNVTYDEFVSRFGKIAENAHLLILDSIPDSRLSLLTELEVEPDLSKAPIFFERTVKPQSKADGQIFYDGELIDRLLSACSKCIQDTVGRVDINYIAMMAGCDAETAEEMLVNHGRLFRDPQLLIDIDASTRAIPKPVNLN